MGRRDQDERRVAVHAEPPRGDGVSLADALRKAGLVPARLPGTDAPQAPRETKASKAGPGGTEDAGTADLSACAKAVLRRERKGHGGHAVTRIEGLGLPAGALQAVAREVARAMGCAARVEGDAVLVAGEPGERLQDWLRARGVRKIARGN